MAKVDQDFTLWTGESKEISVSVVDGNGLPVDLTGASIKWMLCKYLNGAAADVLKTSADTVNGISITSPLTGRFAVHLSSGDTQNLGGTYYHAAQVTDIKNNVTVVLTGKVAINQVRKFQ